MGPNSGDKVLPAKWGQLEEDQVRIASRCRSFPLFSPLALFLCEPSQALRSFNPHLSKNDYVCLNTKKCQDEKLRPQGTHSFIFDFPPAD